MLSYLLFIKNDGAAIFRYSFFEGIISHQKRKNKKIVSSFDSNRFWGSLIGQRRSNGVQFHQPCGANMLEVILLRRSVSPTKLCLTLPL